MLARGLVAVIIDAHDLQIFVDAPLRHGVEQPRADREHRIGLAPQVAAERQRNAERAAAVEHATAAAVGEHGRLQHVAKQRHLGRGILRAAADHDQHAPGLAEHLGRGFHLVVVDAGAALRQRCHRCHRCPLAPDVDGAFERGGSAPALPHGGDRLGDLRRGFLRSVNMRGVIDQAGDNAGLVANLVQLAEPAADRGMWNLPDDRQHRRIHTVGGEQRGAGIEQARPRHDRVGLRLAGRERRAQGHIGRALLVPGVNDAQGVAGAVKGVEQMVVVHAGQRIDGIKPMRDQRGRRGLAGRHLDGGRLGFLGALRFDGHGDTGYATAPNCANVGRLWRAALP